MSFAPVVLVLMFVQAAQAPSPKGPPDLVVTGSYWGRVETVHFDEGEPSSAMDEGRDRKRRAFDPNAPHITRRESYALVRNTGARKAKFVTWAYVFYETAAHEREVKRFEFRTKAALAPGEMKFLVEAVTEAAPTPHGDVLVRRVEYDDGTTWSADSPPASKAGE
jgi:hypothetical protein